MGEHRHLDAEERRGDRRAEERLVALVVGVRDERHDGRDELGARRLDVDRLAAVTVEGDAVVGAGVVARLELGLRHGGLERDVPEARRLALVGLAALEVAQEGLLRDGAGAVVDGAVGDVPVEAEAEAAEERLEGHLVLDGEDVAQLDEVLAADGLLVGGLDRLAVRVDAPLGGRHEVLLVGQGRVAAHAVVVLDPALGRQAVVVPADRVEDLEAAHALVASHAVGVGVAEDVADVQAAARRGRRGVDGEDLVAGQVEGALAGRSGRCRGRPIPASTSPRGRRASGARGSARWVQVRQSCAQSFHGRPHCPRPPFRAGAGALAETRTGHHVDRAASACRSGAAQGRVSPWSPSTPPSSVSPACLFAAQGLKFTILGDENVPTHGGAVMVINHTGYFDFAYAGLAAQKSGRLVRFMAKDSVFTHPRQRAAHARHEAHPRRPGGRGGVVCRRGGVAARRRDRRGLPGGDDLALLRAQGLQERRRADGRGGRRADPPARHLGLAAGLDQGPAAPARPHQRADHHVGGRADPGGADADVNEVTARYKAVMAEMLDVARAAYEPLTGPDLKFLPASLGGTAPTLAEATRLDREEAAERIRKRKEEREKKAAAEAAKKAGPKG